MTTEWAFTTPFTWHTTNPSGDHAPNVCGACKLMAERDAALAVLRQLVAADDARREAGAARPRDLGVLQRELARIDAEEARALAAARTLLGAYGAGAETGGR